MDLRDPIWPGLEAILGIVVILLTALFFVIPEFKAWIRKKIRNIVLVVLALVVFCFCLIAVRPLANGILSLLATSTPTSTSTYTPTPIPTSTPVPTPAYTYLVYDNFDNGAMPAWFPSIGTWQMVNNQYTMTNIGTNWTSGRTVIGNYEWADYQVGAQIYLPNSNSLSEIDNQAEIIIRYQDENDYLALFLNNLALFDTDGSKGFWVTVSNGLATPMANTSFSIDTDRPLNLVIVAQGNIITTYINGVQVSRWSGAEFLNGAVGLGMISKNPSSPPSFDNFFVRTQP